MRAAPPDSLQIRNPAWRNSPPAHAPRAAPQSHPRICRRWLVMTSHRGDIVGGGHIRAYRPRLFPYGITVGTSVWIVLDCAIAVAFPRQRLSCRLRGSKTPHGTMI